ncbi:hypothetical protein AB9L11_00885 [Desulfovibrio piger]
MIRWSLGLTALAVAATLLFCWLWLRSEKHAALLEQELAASRIALTAQEQAMATLKTENERIMQEALHREQALRHIAAEGDLALPELLRRLDGLLDQLPAAGAASGKPAGALPAGAGQP